MGSHNYDYGNRQSRSQSSGYSTKSREELFEKQMHALMDPKKVIVRECRDSEVHPQSVPLIFALDVTGSMGKIPHNMIANTLPKMISGIHEAGFPHISICFCAVGDHLYDKYPLQIGQFESGDEQLDNWLLKTCIEGGGGGNGGESYALPYYFAAFHTSTDAWEKRKQKGFLFTIGDEPCHDTYLKNELAHIFSSTPEKNYTKKELYNEASKKWEIFHLNLGENTDWNSLLGEKNIRCTEGNFIEEVCKVLKSHSNTNKNATEESVNTPSEEESSTSNASTFTHDFFINRK